MPLLIVRNDITKMQVDAIVNPTNPRMRPGGGVDAAVHRAAGPDLARELSPMGALHPGHVVMSSGYNLPCKYIFHTVGPRWYDGWRGEAGVLRECYWEALQMARQKGCRSIAFPLIAAGTLGFPGEKALQVATETIHAFLKKKEMTVYLVVYDEKSFRLTQSRFPEVQAFIEEATQDVRVQAARQMEFEDWEMEEDSAEIWEEADWEDTFAKSAPAPSLSCASRFSPKASSYELEDLFESMDESFSEMLFRKIEEKGLTDAQCYKRANVDRKLFSKIRNPKYKPGKTTVVALAIALELPLEETRDLVSKAGYSMTHNNKFDLIIEYCITRKLFDVLQINEILFSFDQSLLGSA